MLSVIIPAYNEEAMIEKAASAISQILEDSRIPCELIFVDDGSKDRTWGIITAVSARNSVVRGVHFSRNFGKESAIIAGLTGQSVIAVWLLTAIYSILRKKSLRCIAYGNRDMRSLRGKNPAVAQKENYMLWLQRLSIQ